MPQEVTLSLDVKVSPWVDVLIPLVRLGWWICDLLHWPAGSSAISRAVLRYAPMMVSCKVK